MYFAITYFSILHLAIVIYLTVGFSKQHLQTYKRVSPLFILGYFIMAFLWPLWLIWSLFIFIDQTIFFRKPPQR